MGIQQANNVIEAKTASAEQQSHAVIGSMVRLQAPPDTAPLSTVLQTTLNVEELISLFKHEAKHHVAFDAVGYRNNESSIDIQVGDKSRHSANYGLSLLDENLGEIQFTRNTPFSEQDLAIIEHLMAPLLYPLRNGLSYLRALATAYRDPLTRINNRTAMEDVLPREIKRAQRYDQALSMLIVDLDHFKKINDTYGHAAGDHVLKSAASLMRECLRAEDHIFRFGGEEFVVLLPSTDMNDANTVAERIRHALDSHSFSVSDKAIPVSCSIGVTHLDDNDNQHTLFEKADTALYRAKALGRNQVISYEE